MGVLGQLILCPKLSSLPAIVLYLEVECYVCKYLLHQQLAIQFIKKVLNMKCSLHNVTSILLNCSNSTVTKEDLRRLALIRGSAGIVCFILCLATFIFELIYIWHSCRKKRQNGDGSTKAEKTTTLQRLFVYLCFSNVLYTATLSLEIENYSPIRSAEVHCFLCKANGFFGQYTGLVQLILTAGIIIHKLRSFLPRKRVENGILSCHHYKFEALFVVLCFVLPLLVIWVPFTQSGPGEYGVNGAWCWIQVLQDDCKYNTVGLMEQLFLGHVPFIAVSLLSLVCMLAISICLVYICLCYRTYWKRIRPMFLDIFLLTPFLVVFCCVCLIEMIILVLFKLEQPKKLHHLNNYYMLMCLAVVTPVGGVVIPIAFFVYHLRKKCFSLSGKRSRKLHDMSHAQAKTINPSNHKTVNSDSDEGRPLFTRPSSAHWSTSSGSAAVIDTRKGEYGTMD